MIRSRARGIRGVPEANTAGSFSSRVRIRSAGGCVLMAAPTVLRMSAKTMPGSIVWRIVVMASR